MKWSKIMQYNQLMYGNEFGYNYKIENEIMQHLT